MRNCFSLTLLAFCLAGATSAQQFLPPIDRFSGNKPGYLITTAGDRIEFTLDDLDRKKGLIIRVEGKTLDGKKFRYEADQIQELGLTPSDFAKMASVGNSTSSIAKMKASRVDESARNLVVFNQEHLDDPDRTVLVQLINPGFESKIRVYDDPFATQTTGVGFGGVMITGGIDRSYYVKVSGKIIRLKKRNYDEMFNALFRGCAGLMTKYGKSFAWRDFNEHVFFYDQSCP
jgi:hypothetical protein